jgi:Type II CAAX prenyl endopeptidase Rce1-like
MKIPLRLVLPAGLRLFPANWSAAVRAALITVLGVCAFVTALDLAFRAVLPPGYVQFYSAELWPRMAQTCLDAAGEELVYRLGLMTLLAALPMLWGKRAGARWMIAAIVLAQLANVQAFVLIVPPWGGLRFWLVGCVWGGLYWRHGFVTALAGHSLVHLALDPLLLAALG